MHDESPQITGHTVQFTDVNNVSHHLLRVHSLEDGEAITYPASSLDAAALATRQPELFVFETVKGEFIPGHKAVSFSRRV